MMENNTIQQHVNNILENMVISQSIQKELTTIEYINKIFPTEQSLSNIDEVLKIIKEKINVLDLDIRNAICSQKTVEENGRKTLENARNLILNLSNVIIEIKNQAKQSEKIVNEITCNIKKLDNAKRNLTLSIIMLNNLHILVQGTFLLKESTKKRQYNTASKTLQGILDVLKQFNRFKHIFHISKLTNDIDYTCNELGKQILNDFYETFDSKNVSLLQNQIQLLAEGCLVLSILDSKYKRQLISWLVELELAEYKALFQDNQDIAWLDKIDARFSWLKKHLITFEDKIGFLFPPHWEISECIAVEFCKITRQDLIKVMNNRIIEMDVNILLPAISKATAFEKLLGQRFTGATLVDKTEILDKNSKKNAFSGLITMCFENYLNIYVEAQDKNFEKLINQFTEELTKSGTPNVNSKAEIFSSSGKLFTQYKNCLIQCISLSNRTPLVLVSNTFQKYLREYAHKILQNTIPRIGSNISLTSLSNTISNSGSSSGGVFSAASSAAGLIQIFLKDLENKSYTTSEIVQICSIILTSNYCFETTQQLEKKIQEKIDPILVDKINLNPECDIFHGIILNCIQLLSHSIEYSCEQPLNTMVKTSWANMGTPVGHSQYVSVLMSTFYQSFPVIRENLDMSTYFHIFCNKFAETFILKFISNIFKCKPLSQGAAEQLLLDSHTLKKILLELPEYKCTNKCTIPQSYIDKVVSGMTKAEMILKIVLVPNIPPEMFVENYFKLFQKKDLGEFQKIIEMKGIKKSESITLVELFKKMIINENSVCDTSEFSNTVGTISSTSIDSNRIKKLEKLIKKRL